MSIDLEVSQAQLAALIDLTTEAILLLDGEGQLLFCNKAAACYFSINAQEQAGTHFTDLMGNDNKQSVTEAFSTIKMNSRQTVLTELSVKTKAGKPLILESHWQLADSESGAAAV